MFFWKKKKKNPNEIIIFINDYVVEKLPQVPMVHGIKNQCTWYYPDKYCDISRVNLIRKERKKKKSIS